MRTRAKRINSDGPQLIVRSHFQVGAHVLEVHGNGGRWAISVDGVDVAASFSSSADAWTAGVTEADRLDRAAASAPAP